MRIKDSKLRISINFALAFGILAYVCGCTQTTSHTVASLAPLPRLEPATGTYFGVNLDWSTDSPALFNKNLGHNAAIFAQFCRFPLEEAYQTSLDATVKAIAAEGGMVMITLEPWGGLDTVTHEASAFLAERLAEYNAQGVPAIIHFAHEMNGSWYPWSQQPSAYIKAFQLVADAIHSQAPQSAMLWAPNYGGGYPFKDGEFEAKPESADFKLLDTNQDGQLDMTDDPYAPYYPGNDAADWVGMSLYHWGNQYPWGENEIPEADKFILELTGNYNGLNGDERAIPDFYDVYYKGHGKPLAIPDTAAFYDPARPGPGEVVLKQSWWRQVFDPTLLTAYPGIKMINWFEWDKPEGEVGGAVIDWRALGSPLIAEKFRDDLPVDKLVFAPEKEKTAP